MARGVPRCALAMVITPRPINRSIPVSPKPSPSRHTDVAVSLDFEPRIPPAALGESLSPLADRNLLGIPRRLDYRGPVSAFRMGSPQGFIPVFEMGGTNGRLRTRCAAANRQTRATIEHLNGKCGQPDWQNESRPARDVE